MVACFLSNYSECKIIVFDLDDTLHYKHIEIQTLKKDIVDIILYLKNMNFKITMASLNTRADIFLQRYNIIHLFDKVYYKNWIWNGSHKGDLFKDICMDFNVSYENLLLFDDNIHHCQEAKQLGMKYIHVDDKKLIEWDDIHTGLELFNKKKNEVDTNDVKDKDNMWLDIACSEVNECEQNECEQNECDEDIWDIKYSVIQCNENECEQS